LFRLGASGVPSFFESFRNEQADTRSRRSANEGEDTMSIFISYRRGASTDIVGRIHDWLERDFAGSEVIRDVDSIPPGVHFWKHLEGKLAECDLVLAVIGPDWSAGGAGMPERRELPVTVRGLADYQAHSVDSGRDFRSDIAELITALRELRARVAAERARKKEQNEQELEEERQREEKAVRLEALRGAELESLSYLLGETARKRYQALLAVVIGLGVLAAIVGAIFWANDLRDAERYARAERARRAEIERQRVTLEQQLAALRSELKAQDDKARELSRVLNDAKDEAERARIEAALEAAKRAKSEIVQRGGGLKEHFVGGPVNCRCPPGDPLCSCL
jgi:colicin import membrane protein